MNSLADLFASMAMQPQPMQQGLGPGFMPAQQSAQWNALYPGVGVDPMQFPEGGRADLFRTQTPQQGLISEVLQPTMATMENMTPGMNGYQNPAGRGPTQTAAWRGYMSR
jgi:hypothetical protein